MINAATKMPTLPGTIKTMVDSLHTFSTQGIKIPTPIS